ncbi:AN1-type zinc finger protein 1 [Coemansia sp. Benny D115]|nr:AN1-type zinc finger protein 1 [Coemansia sp. Benny D115]
MELPHVGKNCDYESCGVLDFLPMHCGFCDRDFCSKHGGVIAHNCPNAPQRTVDAAQRLPASTNDVPVSYYTHPPRTGPKDVRTESKKTLTGEQLAALESVKNDAAAGGAGSLADKPAVRPTKPPRVSPKIELMRLKAKATGNSSMDMKDRLYMCVRWNTKSLVVFINKRSVIGNAADRFAKQLGVTVGPEKVARLWIPGANEPLPAGKQFSDLLDSSSGSADELFNGCTLELTV